MKNLMIILLSILSFGLSAQTTVDLFNPLPSPGKTIKSDTVVNTATVFLTQFNGFDNAGAVQTTVQVNVTKISGTVAGTISLLGSIDGVNYKAIVTEETQTALPTITATDATASYHWRIKGNPYYWYRVSWTGTGTMSASFSSKVARMKYP